ncbi:hypothetical protein DFH08DRAFT_718392 [Mycena albidolilacea]|uniref:Uncharacterized protein n=1 Tax=Mycena albidolilacea TaxID=1033008 RepID=A0AAD6Z7Z2_9AGAR|nr:hypothetical protein DFH08DRAFT_718392 [Mycena albidolilacea]
MKNLRSARSRDKAREQARIAEKKLKKKNKWSLIEKGKYTAPAKSIARMLHKSGCTEGKVGSVISYIAKHAGLEIEGDMSRCTVQRCSRRALIVGGVAARVQLGYEMADANGVTLSSDATSVRGENYDGAHVMINKGSSHKMRILSLTSTVSHSSETQLENLKKQITNIADIYHRSPLGQRSALNFEVHNFLRVWKGGNGDHAPDVKKFYRLGEGWKRESSRILLGHDKLQRMEPQRLVDLVRDILQSNLREVGGEAEWAKLSNNEKNIRTKSSMDTLAFRLGEEVFETLPEETKREIELFFWAGCSMHKELNCCKAFDDGMKKFYDEHPELDQPVLLANKDNDVTIQLTDDTGESTAAVQRALKVSERGGVKLVSLFIALVNHKDDKKGLHDIYENYFRPTIGAGVRFPDVSNTRYQSHGRGGARIIAYLKGHRDFMDFVKDNKQKRMLNHLEQNIVKGIHCPQTTSQIVALVLFCMAVMHPYALHVRGPGTENLNMLDLGPYHSSVKERMKKLIADPTALFSPSTDSYKIATLDGQPWSDTKAWAACIELFPTLPHVQPLMLAGLKSALECFERFTTESMRLSHAALVGVLKDFWHSMMMVDLSPSEISLVRFK